MECGLSLILNRYGYIIDYIENDAHEKVENMNYMRWLIEQAEHFRNSK